MNLRRALELPILVLIFSKLTSSTASEWKVIFEDDFNGDSLNLTKWEYQTGCTEKYGKGNYQCYVPGTNNANLSNGLLTITAKIENYENKNFTSGRIRQLGDGTRYGKFEIRARQPFGLLLFPALWLKSKDGPCYEEIDMLEIKGQEPKRLLFTAHWGTPMNLVHHGVAPTTLIDSSKNFHVYEMNWTPEWITWYVDKKEYFSVSTDSSQWTNPNNVTTCSTTPFKQPQNLIINMAVGSSGMFSNGNYITPQLARQNWTKPTLEVDYVRISTRN